MQDRKWHMHEMRK